MKKIYKKAIRLLRVFFMSFLAPLAVRLKLNWPKALSFLGKENMKKLKMLRTQSNPNELLIKRMEDQTIEYFREIISRDAMFVDEQDWIDASRGLGALYFLQGKMKEINKVFEKEANFQREIAKTHQFDDLGIEFLPRYLAMGSIGNYEHLEIFVKAQMLGLRPLRKLVLLVEPNTPINNPCYLNYWKRYITVISNSQMIEILVPLEKRLTIPINVYMSLRGIIHKSFLAVGIVREQWIQEKKLPVLTLSDKDYERGWQTLKSFGMQQGDWFVCLHVREKGWKDNKSSTEDFRNADINTYELAIKTITDAGGWVIRTGDSTMKPLPKMLRVIDYAHSDSKSDWMDVFLCAQCRFFVGTSSGLFIFATSFGTPVVATNFLPTCCAYYLTSNDLFIPRICKIKDRFLDFAEFFSPSMGTAAVQCIYDFKDIEIMENSEEEIRDLVEEMLERCDGRLKYREEDEILQKRFKVMSAGCGKSYGEENAVVNARIGRSFLRKHMALLSPEMNVESVVEK